MKHVVEIIWFKHWVPDKSIKWNGWKIQRRFKTSLPMVIIQKDSSEDIKYDVFSRINQGSIKLNGQEL